jgi:hypothetical protein
VVSKFFLQIQTCAATLWDADTLAMARSKNHAHIIEWATAMGCPAN